MKKNKLPVYMILLGITIVLIAATYNTYLYKAANPDPAPLPGNLSGLRLETQTYGPSAIVEINQLHRQSFPLTSGAVGMYGAQHQVKVWISGTPFPFLSKQMIKKMEARIGEGNSPFLPTGTNNINGTMVYQLEGLGQKHFYFQSGAYIIWVATDANLVTQVLEEILEFYT